MSNEKKIILKVIELYKDMPFLWDKDNLYYKNRTCRRDGYQILLNVYKKLYENATLKTVTKKIQNLRTNYNNELKKVRQSIKAGDREIYKPTLWYYDAFRFLEGEANDQCPSISDSMEVEELSLPPDSDTEYDIILDEPSKSPKQKRKKRKSREIDTLDNQDYTLNISDKYLKREDDWEVFGKAIGLQLRDLERKQLIITQKLISDTIYYAKMDLLSENSFVALGSTNRETCTSPSTSQIDSKNFLQ